MSRSLGLHSRLDTLKKEAKRWLKALRDDIPDARRRLLAVMPDAPASPGLRDVQLALAREYGFAGWSALRDALDDLELARRTLAERVDVVVRSATWGGDRAGAERVLRRWPEIGAADLYAAVSTGNLIEVQRRLATDPSAATRAGGPLEREPLLYLAYARLPGSAEDALEIATLLLDYGANPNARFSDDWGNLFTVLTGIVGQGEGDQPSHPQAEALASLLLERGADPFDTQVLYNTSITRDDVAWLEMLWSESERRGALARWHVEGAIGGKLPCSALDYLLGNAVAYDHLARAEWLLRHGANPNAPHAYSTRPLRVEALVYGHARMAKRLERFGADVKPLDGHDAFQAACLALERDAAEAAVRRDPRCLTDAGPMRLAARTGRADVVALLLELGVDVDVTDATGIRGLQDAVAGGSLDVVRLLVAHGADIDRPSKQYGGAIGFAAHFKRHDIAQFLAPLSHDVHNLTTLGMRDRLHELFSAEPALVNRARAQSGFTPLFMLPDDEDDALDMAMFLLDQGADSTLTDAAGISAIEAARVRGLIDAAELMHERANSRAKS